MKFFTKRKWVLSSVIATSLFALTACGSVEKTTSNQEVEKGETQHHLKVGYLQANVSPCRLRSIRGLF